MPLLPDSTYKVDGLIVKEYFLTKHNPNKISMPFYTMPAKPVGVTIHNTDQITVASNTTPAEQYTRATVNGHMKDVRVHFYVDEECAWQNLPLTLSGWHAADGNGGGNRKTIAIEIIGSSKKAEENGIKLAAWLLNKYELNIDHLYTHTYWLNVRDGKKGTLDSLNTQYNKYKMCPSYILPHWQEFKNKVKEKLNIKDSSPTVAPAVKTSRETLKETPKVEKKVEVDPTYEKLGVAAQSEVDVFYQVYTKRKWLPIVKNLEDYAGIKGKPFTCLAALTSQGKLTYRVHQLGSYWMKWVNKYDLNHIDGYAGIGGVKIDAVQIKLEDLPGYTVRYRVAAVGQDYYPWIAGADNNTFAGLQGKQIDRIQIEIVKIRGND